MTPTKESTPKEVRAAVVEDLRSGKHRQGYGQLRTKDDEFCCLGRICELAVAAGVIPPPRLRGEDYYYGPAKVEPTATATRLPEEVRRWVGFANKCGSYGRLYGSGSGRISSLSDDNDAYNSFATIADTIAREPEGLLE